MEVVFWPPSKTGSEFSPMIQVIIWKYSAMTCHRPCEPSAMRTTRQRPQTCFKTRNVVVRWPDTLTNIISDWFFTLKKHQGMRKRTWVTKNHNSTKQQTFRTNYQDDVIVSIALCLYALLNKFNMLLHYTLLIVAISQLTI